MLGLAFCAGLAMSPGTVSGDNGKLLITFLGFVSASVLPTISLLINNMTASGRSVKALDDLENELQASMDALFLLFGCAAVVVGALLALATPPPRLFAAIPYLTDEILPRGGQGIVIAASALIIGRAGQLPAILRRMLQIRHQIAVEEARRKTLDNAPKDHEVKAAFPTHPEYGQSVSIDETKRH